MIRKFIPNWETVYEIQDISVAVSKAMDIQKQNAFWLVFMLQNCNNEKMTFEGI